MKGITDLQQCFFSPLHPPSRSLPSDVYAQGGDSAKQALVATRVPVVSSCSPGSPTTGPGASGDSASGDGPGGCTGGDVEGDSRTRGASGNLITCSPLSHLSHLGHSAPAWFSPPSVFSMAGGPGGWRGPPVDLRTPTEKVVAPKEGILARVLNNGRTREPRQADTNAPLLASHGLCCETGTGGKRHGAPTAGPSLLWIPVLALAHQH